MRVLVFIIGLFSVIVSHAQVSFHDVADSLNINTSYNSNFYGGGVSFVDFNGDGWDDLTIGTASGDTIQFYENRQGTFVKLSPPLVLHTKEVKQILWADYDNDGDKDLFLSAFNQGNHLYQNDGFMQFTDVTAQAGISTQSMYTFGACWGDIDNDGRLDLYVTNRVFNNSSFSNDLYRNLGNGTFEDITISAGVADSFKAPFMPVFFDYNNDGWQDIYIAQDKFMVNSLFRNNGNNTFSEIGPATNASLLMNGMCVAVGDYDDNGFFDLYITNTDFGNRLLKHNGNGTYTELGDSLGVGFNGIGWGSHFLDGDNDMDLDLYVSGQLIGTDSISSQYYRNDGLGQLGQGIFSKPTDAGFDGDTVQSFSNAVGDFNNDGFPDIAVVNRVPFNFQLWKNSGGDNNWLKVQLQGTQSNRDGIGSVIEVFVGGNTYKRYTHAGSGYISQNSTFQLLGLGNDTLVDSLRVTWLSGATSLLKSITANQRIKVVEGCNTIIDQSVEVGALPPYCQGEAVELIAKGFKGYEWSTGELTDTILVSTSGIYYVTVTDSAGCTFWEAVNVSFEELPQVSIAMEDSTYCANDSEAYDVMLDPEGGTLIGEGIINGQFVPDRVGVLGTVSLSYSYTDAVGCTGSDSLAINIDNCLNISNAGADLLNVYPNPFHDRFMIELPTKEGPVKVRIYGVTGKLLYQDDLALVSKRESIVLNDPIAPGVYWLKLVVSGDVYYQKLIKY